MLTAYDRVRTVHPCMHAAAASEACTTLEAGSWHPALPAAPEWGEAISRQLMAAQRRSLMPCMSPPNPHVWLACAPLHACNRRWTRGATAWLPSGWVGGLVGEAHAHAALHLSRAPEQLLGCLQVPQPQPQLSKPSSRQGLMPCAAQLGCDADTSVPSPPSATPGGGTQVGRPGCHAAAVRCASERWPRAVRGVGAVRGAQAEGAECQAGRAVQLPVHSRGAPVGCTQERCQVSGMPVQRQPMASGTYLVPRLPCNPCSVASLPLTHLCHQLSGSTGAHICSGISLFLCLPTARVTPSCPPACTCRAAAIKVASFRGFRGLPLSDDEHPYW